MKLYENRCNPMSITVNKEKNVHYRQNWNLQPNLFSTSNKHLTMLIKHLFVIRYQIHKKTLILYPINPIEKRLDKIKITNKHLTTLIKPL